MYKFNQTGEIIDSNGSTIPKHTSNRDYVEYLKWVSEDNIAEAYVAPLPSVVTMRQARLALLNAGLLQTVNDAIASLPSPQKEAAIIEWEYSAEVHKDRPLIQVLAPAIGLTSEQLDQLFVTASTL